MRKVCIWLTTMAVCTFGTPAYMTISFWNDQANGNRMSGGPYGPSDVTVVVIIFGIGGFIVSLFLAPAIVTYDQLARDLWNRIKFQEQEAPQDFCSLLCASECSPVQHQAELLRPTHAGSVTPPEQLLRPVQPGQLQA